MAKFRRINPIVEATQFTEETTVAGLKDLSIEWDGENIRWVVNTRNGGVPVKVGDWIVTDILGMKYPCADDVFKATYKSIPG